MKVKFFEYLILIAILAFAASCARGPERSGDGQDTTANAGRGGQLLTGEATIIVDEAALPIVNEQIEVYKTSYEGSNINVLALPEREAINALIQGKGSIAILARELSTEESAGFNKRKIKPRVFPIYHDGVVFVNNITAPDTAIDVKTLTSVLKGESDAYTLVFDNLNSSTVRRVKELTKVARISGRWVKPQKTSKEVFEQLLSDPKSIGVVSYGQYLEYRRLFGEENKIRILSLQSLKDGKELGYFKPSQSTFATDEYPLETNFYVLNYQPNMGLGIGFSAFLTGDRGQRIVLKSGLLPATMPGREIIIRDGNVN